MKLLIAVESCKTNRHLHQAMLDTWLKDTICDFKFFIGGINEPAGAHEVWVPAIDTYDGLVAKTKGICQWANAQGYDFLFKCDTDTVVHPGRLLARLGGFNFDYLGGFNEDILPTTLDDVLPDLKGRRVQFASGGAGYWLSNHAMVTVAKGWATVSPAEDVYVAGKLRIDDGIYPEWDDTYRWRPGEPIKGATTFHLSSALKVKHRPELMYEYYKKILDNPF